MYTWAGHAWALSWWGDHLRTSQQGGIHPGKPSKARVNLAVIQCGMSEGRQPLTREVCLLTGTCLAPSVPSCPRSCWYTEFTKGNEWNKWCIMYESLGHVWLFAPPKHCSLPGSSVHGILQARTLEWVAMPSSRGFSQPRDWTQICNLLTEDVSSDLIFTCQWQQSYAFVTMLTFIFHVGSLV